MHQILFKIHTEDFPKSGHIHHFYARLSAQKLHVHVSILQQSIELDPSCRLCYHHLVQTSDKVNVSCKRSVGVPHPAHDTVDYLPGFW